MTLPQQRAPIAPTLYQRFALGDPAGGYQREKPMSERPVVGTAWNLTSVVVVPFGALLGVSPETFQLQLKVNGLVVDTFVIGPIDAADPNRYVGLAQSRQYMVPPVIFDTSQISWALEPRLDGVPHELSFDVTITTEYR